MLYTDIGCQACFTSDLAASLPGVSLLSHTPTFTAADAEAITRTYFAISGSARALPGERDQNFRIDVYGAPAYVLKIANGVESADVLSAQHGAAERALAAGIPVQRVERSVTGADRALHDGYIVRLLSWLPGRTIADVAPWSPELVDDLGGMLGRLSRALAGYDHPAAQRDFHWDVARAHTIVDELRGAITDPARRGRVDAVHDRLVEHVVPVLPELRHGVIHGDANDLNVLVDAAGQRVCGLLDFGDIVHSVLVAEVAVAAAYVVHHSDDPFGSVAQVVAAFHAEQPLSAAELSVLWDLVLARQALSACHAAVQHAARPDDPYLTISEQPAWDALELLSGINPRLAHYRLRDACGLDPHPQAGSVRRYLAAATPAPLLGQPWAALRTFPVDLGLDSEMVLASDAGAEPERFDRLIRSVVDGDAAAIGIGGYGEQRRIYTGPEYDTGSQPQAERRSLHLAVDVWTPAGTPVCAPLPGRVVVLRDNDIRLDYGPVVMLEHETDGGVPFWSLYGHLSLSTLKQVVVGQAVAAGDVIGFVGTPPTNGDWAPHVHVQVILDLLDLGHDYPGVGPPSQRRLWLGLSPDPALLMHGADLTDGRVPPARA